MLSAVIVAFQTPAELAAAVASLKTQSRPPDEIIIVDNGAASGQPVPESLAAPDVRVIRTDHNVGFGAGCNRGAAEAAGDELLLMNADVVLAAGAVDALMRQMGSDPSLAAVGPRILAAGKLQLSARAFPSMRTGLLGRRSLVTRALVLARRHPAEFRPALGRAGRVDWISGACMLLRTAPFRELGGFDEGYFMYWEDADLCRRLQDAGWGVAYEPRAIVHHATGASGTSEQTIAAFHASAARFGCRYIARTALERRLIDVVLRARCRVVLAGFRRRGRSS